MSWTSHKPDFYGIHQLLQPATTIRYHNEDGWKHLLLCFSKNCWQTETASIPSSTRIVFKAFFKVFWNLNTLLPVSCIEFVNSKSELLNIASPVFVASILSTVDKTCDCCRSMFLFHLHKTELELAEIGIANLNANYELTWEGSACCILIYNHQINTTTRIIDHMPFLALLPATWAAYLFLSPSTLCRAPRSANIVPRPRQL